MGIQIYILYNYELYKLTIKIYVHKYVLVLFFSINSFKRIVTYFYNHTKNLYNKFEFLKN